MGHLGGSVGLASDFSSGHDLAVCEFKPHIGLCADSSEPGACFGFCVLSTHRSSPRALVKPPFCTGNISRILSWLLALNPNTLIFFLPKKFSLMFIYIREREGEGQREKETQNPKKVPGSKPSAQSPTWGLNPQTVRS